MATHFIENAIVEKSCIVSIENRKKNPKTNYSFNGLQYTMFDLNPKIAKSLDYNTLFNENINILVHNVGVVTGSESK